MYEFKFSGGCPLVKIDDMWFVIDTGSPISFYLNGWDQSLIINGEEFALPENPLGIDRDELELMIGEELAGILGLDILIKQGSLLLDQGNNMAGFGIQCAPDNSREISFGVRNVMGLKALEIEAVINGSEAKAIFDTGASIGYVNKALLGAAEHVGHITDYAPSFAGNVETESYMVDIRIEDSIKKCKVAQMTSLIEMSVGLLGYNSILGLNELEWSVFLIDFSKQVISIS